MEEGSRSCSSCSSDDDPFARRSVRRRYDNNPLPENFDLISNLPDSILIHILSSLPLTDVIATETLSKRWRFLLKMVPNLVFRHCASYPSSKPSALVSFIYKALLLHECSRIDEFSVGFEYRPKFRSAVDVWLHVAIGKNVEEINLDFPFYSYTLPQHLYTSSSLVKLTLTRCSMEEPRAVVSWPSLKILSIGSYPELNDSLIESILSGTPALESLELRECRGFSRLNITSASLKKLVINSWDVLQISAPKVESLSILGSTHEKKMSLNLPSLHFGTLNFELRVVEGDEDFKNSNRVSGRLMTNLLKTLNRVEELTLGNWCIQVLSVLDLQKLTAPICTCKRLILTSRFSRWDNPGIANLLRSSVSLETLVINITQPLVCIEILLQGEDGFRKLYKRNGKLDDKKHWNSQEGALLVNSLQHLKTVKIIDNIADRFLHQMQIELLRGVLQVILKNARELEKVVICTEMFENGVLINSIEVAHRLLSFPRASSSAVILCYNC